jgi:hypothetical protein
MLPTPPRTPPTSPGKSTLLDILAARKTVGRLAGAVCVNGALRGADAFLKASAYVPQVGPGRGGLLCGRGCALAAAAAARQPGGGWLDGAARAPPEAAFGGSPLPLPPPTGYQPQPEPQEDAFLPTLSVGETCELHAALRLGDIGSARRAARVDEVLASMNMLHARNTL